MRNFAVVSIAIYILYSKAWKLFGMSMKCIHKRYEDGSHVPQQSQQPNPCNDQTDKSQSMHASTHGSKCIVREERQARLASMVWRKWQYIKYDLFDVIHAWDDAVKYNYFNCSSFLFFFSLFSTYVSTFLILRIDFVCFAKCFKVFNIFS